MIKHLYKLFFCAIISLCVGCIPHAINTAITDSSSISDLSYDLSRTDYSDENIESVVKLSYIVILPDRLALYSSATGFSIKYDKKNDVSYIITNDHFCSGNPDFLPGVFNVKTSDGVINPRELSLHPATIITTDPVKDLCLLSTSGKIKPVKLESKNYRLGKVEDSVIIGAPNGNFPIVIDAKITGRVSREVLDQNDFDGANLLLISGVVYHGESGSPIFDSRGRVIGVVFICFSNERGPTYGGLGIPVEDVYKFLNDFGFKI